MFGSGREALTDIREWFEDPAGCLGVVRRPSWMSGSCREALPNVREWVGGPPECLGGHPRCTRVVGRLSRMSGTGR